MEFIKEHLSAIIVCVFLSAIVALIVRKMLRDRRAGKSGCNCGCSGCTLSDKCHKKGE